MVFKLDERLEGLKSIFLLNHRCLKLIWKIVSIFIFLTTIFFTMKHLAIINFFFISMCSSFGQELHNPAQIFAIMDSSKVRYEIKQLEEPIECPDRSDNLNLNDVYLLENDGARQILTYDTLSTEGQKYYDLAEYYYTARNLDSARILYEKVLETDPGYYKLWTYIAQVYGTLGYAELAKKYYQQTISKNRIDYLAHWLLADIYHMQNMLDSAAYQITIASILNRNNPRLQELQHTIYIDARLSVDDWCFNPQIIVEQVDSSRVSMQYADNWLMYAMCKALWNFEPGYKESMGVATGQYSTVEERECLLNLMVGLINSKAKFKKDPSLATLKKAFNAGMVDEYIMYEIFLPKHPEVAYNLSEDFIESIHNYVLTIRYAR